MPNIYPMQIVSITTFELLQGERIDDLKMIVGRSADAATLFDHDGISVRFMNSTLEGNNIKSSSEATNLIGQVHFFTWNLVVNCKTLVRHSKPHKDLNRCQGRGHFTCA